MGLFLFITSFLLLSCYIRSNTIPAINCIVNKNKYMTCLWNGQGLQSINYSLYYWYTSEGPSSVTPCSHYLCERKVNTGCWFNSSMVKTFIEFNVILNSTQRQHVTKIPNLQDLVKLDPPYYLHVENTSSLELLLTWKTLSGVFSKDCVGYQVQHRTSDSDLWTVKDVTSNRFSFPSYNPDQLYIFQVRSKLNSLCASTKLWSDWSSAVTWGRNSTKNMNASGETFISAISIGSSLIFILILILVMLIRTDRIWVILVPQLPNPKKNFEDLYNMYNGNFQFIKDMMDDFIGKGDDWVAISFGLVVTHFLYEKEWTGVSKEVVESFKHNYTEPLCIVSEDTECIGVDA